MLELKLQRVRSKLHSNREGKRYMLTMVEATTGWLETYPVPHATARNTILGLKKQVRDLSSTFLHTVLESAEMHFYRLALNVENAHPAFQAVRDFLMDDPPPPIPNLEDSQKCFDDLQLTDWHEVRREICKEENLNPLAMPVIFSQQAGGPRTWTAIPSQDIKELRKAIKDSGICSPYFKQLLKSTLEGHTLTPNDCKTLAGIILTDSQYMLWEFKWRRLLTNVLQMYRQCPDVDLRTLTMSKLTGDPPDDQNDNQVNLPRIALDDIKKMAREAFVPIQPAGSFEKAYNLISQIHLNHLPHLWIE
ncbi:hypothetical protein DUI87_19197 [Hirundo rustica rustica]|uniref:Core shell protein Gag P30 domain-containing protein n=1 Tax=Hirundo rustica rustica TaxID=333673 RepID=A0A3M0JTL0_HIRRU|nr:hypothetical protein DUI87_19197 [Hirundo rustica rustica]